jgi:hypothetical protein
MNRLNRHTQNLSGAIHHGMLRGAAVRRDRGQGASTLTSENLP